MKSHETVPPPAAEPGTPSEVELARALDAYMAAVEAGRPPDPEQLLAEHAAVADRLRACLASLRLVERAAGSLADAAADGGQDDAQRPEVLGDFRIIREVGRGGMGVVYEAEQVSLGRRVALKVLPFAATMDPRHLQRFHNEARAAAGLHHTNIVPVYAVGQERGVHYYAMQFIDGHTLAGFIAQQRREGVQQVPTTPEAEAAAASATTARRAAQATSAAPRDAAYFRQVAEWGIQAAEALDCAHQLGVVHRDVKPGNLLVDAAGRLWVTDFGLAQVQSDARLTMTGDLVGTLRYMSPEQALAKRVVIDHRTDVYSLGATLYELLTLQPAYSGHDRQELLRQIAFEEPRPLRRINRAIPAELETIILKALEKNPAERYGTAQELADDLRRWLDDRPIQARRPTPLQRLRKWCRRHSAFVGAVAAVALIGLLLGSGTGIWWLQKRAAAEREVELALQEAIRFQDKENWADALSAARRAEGLLAGGSVNVALQQRVRERRADLEMAKTLEDIPMQVHDSGGNYVPATLAAAYARAFRDFGIDVEAMDPGEAGQRIRARTIPLQLAAALEAWGLAVARSERATKAPTTAPSKLLAVARAVDPDPLRNRFRDALEGMDPAALKELAASEEAAQLGAASLNRLGSARVAVGAHKEAAALLQRAQREYPGNFSINESLAFSLAKMRPPRLEEAVRFFTAAVALHPENPGAHINLGIALGHSGDMAGAIEAFKAAIRLSPAYSYAYNNLGSALWGSGDLDGAIQAYKEGVRLRPDVRVTHLNLGNALQAKGALDQAAEQYRETIRLGPDYFRGYVGLAQVFVRKQQFAQAREVYRVGLEKVSDPDGVEALAHDLRECDHFAELDGKLPRILSGEAQPADNAERLELARWCAEHRQLDAAAARLYGDAFEQEPAAASNLDTGDRYNAACAAALAGCGRGEDAKSLDEQKLTRLRRQALDWLRADLAAWQQLLEKEGDKARAAAAKQLAHCLEDTDFASVRGPEALAKLPEAERRDWQKLWDDVEALRRRAAGPPAAAPKSKAEAPPPQEKR
jgi:serine/threonine protein kinase/Tfp pilus assembly protein PilF